MFGVPALDRELPDDDGRGVVGDQPSAAERERELHAGAAVGHQGLTRHVAREVGRQEGHHLGDLLGLAHPAERDRAGRRFTALLARGRQDAGRPDRARRHRVDPHALRRQLDRERLDERDQPRLSVAHESESSGWRDVARGATFRRPDGGPFMPTPVIVSATRTAIGTLGGALAQTPATRLGGVVVREAMRRAHLEPAQVDEVILGHVLPAGLGLNPGRVAALDGGVPKEVPSFTVNKACGSGLKAVVLAAQAIQLGDAEVIVAGGMESMSGAPYILKKARFGIRLGHDEILDSMIADGLTCPITFVHMGITAENIASKYGISRNEQDEFAAESQQKTAAAQQGGKFKAEIVPVEIPAKKGETLRFDTDEHPRGDTTAQRLAGLKPAFKKDGSVTAGNASGINDGAAAVVVATAERAARLGRRPLAKILSFASTGVDPAIMGMGPVPAVTRALERAKLNASEIDLFELNEAFAVQAVAVLKELKLDAGRVNTRGGAIALGHPIGASGARILTTLIYALRAKGGGKGVASLCIGGGMGIAMVIEVPAA